MELTLKVIIMFFLSVFFIAKLKKKVRKALKISCSTQAHK